MPYIIEYANTHGYIGPSYASSAGTWNKSKKKEIKPKRISDIVVRKRIRSKYQNTNYQDAEAREQTRLCALQTFDSRQEPHRTKTNEQVSSLINNLLEVCLEAILFKSIEQLEIPIKNNANIIDTANEIIYKMKANDEKITEFCKTW